MQEPEITTDIIATEAEDDDLELAVTIAQLWLMGLVEETIDHHGVPRFTPIPSRFTEMIESSNLAICPDIGRESLLASDGESTIRLKDCSSTPQ